MRRKSQAVHLELSFFRHFDYETIASNGTLFQWRCHVISNPGVRVSDLSLFESEKYARSKQTSQNKGQWDLQLLELDVRYNPPSLLRCSTPKRKLTILDVGCFDRRLLEELDKKLNALNYGVMI